MTEHYIDSHKIKPSTIEIDSESYERNLLSQYCEFSIDGKPNNKVSNIISTYNISSYILLKHALCVYVFVQVSWSISLETVC